MSSLAGPSTASRFSGSFAYSVRRRGSQAEAPEAQASASATTWSICTCRDRAPAVNAICRPVYGSASRPPATAHRWAFL
ncbi:hypothetical protein A5N15_04855 [Rothia kristinae]|uniref:Uncharacterized protein n=1 Tax=Rothia kristinae TaxID=37923 RepID=A0A657IW96_9MICC|nr:hypothetical protein A5N15_04855 [Rothia kristinae]